ncbi:signal peptidase I [Kitasatospora sp. NPDC056138]|uniref:signal peptidase I n=1 Tax=Kitasatospora sp. NPDC056138 TaxID=3345724 RepID=UPI0035D92877
MIGIALALAFVIKTFFIQAFYIPSGSMENTLRIGDRVLVDKLTPWLGSTPSRGDVIVFRDPGDWLKDEPVPHVGAVHRALSLVGLVPSADEQDLIKRVIAVGGDTVKCTAGSPVSVNGVALDEPYLYPGATPCDNDSVGTVTVPEGKLWVMGDHRNNSADSRYHQLAVAGDGFVPLDHVVGRAVVVAWPVTHWATLPEPATFDQPRLQARATADAPEAEAPGLLGLASAVPLTLWLRRRRTAAADPTPPGADAPRRTE